jgi:hypothetical protein
VKDKKLSLCLVRLAVKAPAYPNMLCAALTSSAMPALCHDKTWIHGRCVTYSLPTVQRQQEGHCVAH